MFGVSFLKKYLITSLLLISIHMFGLENQERIDSLLNKLSSVKSDTGKITLLLDIAQTYRNFETKNALIYSTKALKLARQINNNVKIHNCLITHGLIHYRIGNNNEAITYYLEVINNAPTNSFTRGKAFVNIGNLYADMGKYDSSITFYNNAATIFHHLGDVKYQANVINNIGTIYSDLGDYGKAIDNYTKALNLYDNDDNTLGKASCIENIGVIYYYQNNYNKSNEYFKKALVLFKSAKVLEKQANVLNNIASISMLMDDKELAITYFKEAEVIFSEMNDIGGEALIAQNLSQVYFQLKRDNEGLASIKKGIKLYKKIDGVKGLGNSYTAIGSYYSDNKNYNKAVKNYLKAESFLEPLGVKNDLRGLYLQIAKSYSNSNNHKKATPYYEKFIALNDSIFNREKNHQITEMQEKYDSEEKQQEIELQQVEIEKQNAEVAHQAEQKVWFGVGMGLTLILLLIAFRGYRQKKQANSIITNQKNIVEEKNKEIIDSINYAKRIQNALLNSEKSQTKNLPDHFIFFNPKDIVSGDFYWTLRKQNHLYLAVSDCTGHGVPGALLTMLGTAFLNEITAHEGSLSPAEILNELRSKIIKELNQTGAEGENKDGMDMSLIRLNINTKEIEWAGANNPLWLIKNSLDEVNSSLKLAISKNNKHLYEIKPDKQPISYFEHSKPFTNHKIALEKDDLIYLFTDGYADQFGGAKGKKFKYKPFKELLTLLADKSISTQKEMLEQNFIEWKGELEQIDDVCVIGVRI